MQLKNNYSRSNDHTRKWVHCKVLSWKFRGPYSFPSLIITFECTHVQITELISHLSLPFSVKKLCFCMSSRENTRKKCSTVAYFFIVVWCILIVFLGSFNSLDMETLQMYPCWLIRTIQGHEIFQGWFFSPVLSSPSVFHPYKTTQHYTVSQVSKKDDVERGNTFRNSLFINKIIF